MQSCNFSHDLHKNHTLDYYKLKGSQGENEKYELTKTMNEIVSNPVNVCRDICSEGRENSARGVTRNQAKTNPLRMPPASAEHFCVCESNMAAQDGALTTKL